jgi:hypothetical protein
LKNSPKSKLLLERISLTKRFIALLSAVAMKDLGKLAVKIP